MWFDTVTWGGLHYWHLMVGVREAKVPSGLMEQNFLKKMFYSICQENPIKQHLMKGTRNGPSEETKE